MKLENLLPRPLNPSAGGESVTVMNALFARVHLDRRLARSIGWRGVRPSFSHGQAWTMRSAAADAVFGLAFIDETAADGLLSGRFAVYAFPDPETPAWSSLPPEAKSLAELPDFREKVRSLSEHAAALGVFRTGEMVLDIALNGCGLALTLSAQEKSEDSSADPFERSAPLFALLAQSLRAELEEEGEALKLAETNEAGETMLSITLALGRFVGLLPGERLDSLPGVHVPKEEESQQRPVIHVLTGFLGAGKTTFLKSWLAYLNGRERFTGVVQNEFGEVDLDSLVLRGETKVEALDDGCVCCTLADSLRPGIERLLQETPAEQFVLETTGVADPMNVMYSLLALKDLVERGLLITVVDSYDLTTRHSLLEDGGPDDRVRLNQILNADVVVCSKADAAEEDALEALMAAIHQLNPDALVIPAFEGSIPFAVLDKFWLHWLDRESRPMPSRQTPKARPEATADEAVFGQGRHSFGAAPLKKQGAAAQPASAQAFESLHLPFDKSISTDDLREIVQTAGPGLDRMKGIVGIAGEGPCIIQYAAGVLGREPADDAVMRAWQSSRQGSGSGGFLILIGRHLSEAIRERAA